jgi:cell division protein FtsB
VRAGHLHNEPPPVGVWTALNRVLLTLIIITALAVIGYRILPETGRRKAQAEQIAAMIEQVEKQKQQLARGKREAALLARDPEFLELIARDRLDLVKDGEKVYRLEQDLPAPAGSAKGQTPKSK